MTSHRPDDEDSTRDLIRVDGPIAAGAESLARVVDQSNREAAANRAQARELIKALEGVQRSQEYLGVALREERRKSRWLAALLALAPIAVAAGAWLVVRHVDSSQAEVARRVDRLAADGEARRAEEATKQRDARVAELSADLAAFRRDLEVSREALAAERKQVADREAALAAAHSRGEAVRGELGAFEFELKSAKAAAHAEAARADALASRIDDLQADLSVKSGSAWVTVPPESVEKAEGSTATTTVPKSSVSGSESTVSSPLSVEAPRPVAPTSGPPPEAPAEPPAVPSTPEEAEKARGVLNVLLRDAGDAVRYEFRALGGITGRSLRDVLVVGADDRGTILRTIQAARAEIEVDKGAGVVVIRFFEGKLIVGSKQAPFFDGTYGLVVRGEASKWKSAAFTFLR